MPVYNPCGLLIKQVHDSLEKKANNDLRSQDLTMAQVSVLLELNDSDGKTAALKELEKTLHVAQSTAAGIISRLEQKGLVEGFGDSSDKRIKMVKITEKGEECCLHAYKSMKDTEKALLSGLSKEEQKIFQQLLQRASNNLM